jgi:hypothetical protein
MTRSVVVSAALPVRAAPLCAGGTISLCRPLPQPTCARGQSCWARYLCCQVPTAQLLAMQWVTDGLANEKLYSPDFQVGPCTW